MATPLPDNAAPTADPITLNIETVAALHQRAEQQVSRHQRLVEGFTEWLGRPQFFFGILVGVSLWSVANLLLRRLTGHDWDDPPFFWMQGGVSLLSLLTTVVVLVTQNRQGKLAERREHLDLQMTMLTDQKTAKIIELLEELRRDMPHVRDRVDPEAEAMTEPVDPDVVLTALEFKLEQAEAAAVGLEEAALKTEEVVVQALDEVTALREETRPPRDGEGGAS